MTDLPLFMEHPVHNGTRTSRDAAADIRPQVHSLRAKVLTYIATRGAAGATAQEIEIALGMPGSTVRPRLCELREHGSIVDTGETRKTLAGRKAVAWRLA